MSPIAPLKALLVTYFKEGLTDYQPTPESAPATIPSFADWGTLGIWPDDIPSTLEDGKKPAAAGPDVVIFNAEDPKPQYPNDQQRWKCPIAFDLTLPGDTSPEDANLYWLEMEALLMAKLHADEPDDQLRAPLTTRLNMLLGNEGTIFVQDVIDWKVKEQFNQMESGGLTRSISATFIVENRTPP